LRFYITQLTPMYASPAPFSASIQNPSHPSPSPFRSHCPLQFQICSIPSKTPPRHIPSIGPSTYDILCAPCSYFSSLFGPSVSTGYSCRVRRCPSITRNRNQELSSIYYSPHSRSKASYPCGIRNLGSSRLCAPDC
jgi:hypothetical protein